jgi:phosphatidylinositol alpha-mannosyltransferase
MKIALVSPYDFAFPGGVTVHIEQLAQEFIRQGHETWIIAPSSQPANTLPVDRFVRLGVPVPVPAGGSVARLSLSPWLLRNVRELLERERFDVVHVHEPLTPLLPWLVLHSSKTINIGTFHAYHDQSRIYPWAAPSLRHWFRKLHGRIAVSPLAKMFVERHFPGDYRVIPNGIDLNRYQQDAQPFPEYLDGKINVLFVGRMEKRKGLKYLLMAYSRLKWQFPNLRLLVVGPGTPDKDSFRVLGEHSLRDVEFVGGVSQDDLVRYYKTADIFCSPATGKESFGIVLLEAMASGTPIVASRLKGFQTVLEEGMQGLMAPPKDDVALADALRQMIQDPTMRSAMGAFGERRAYEFRWERVAGLVLDYYESVRAEVERNALSPAAA